MKTEAISESFQPGDGTNYNMHLTSIPGGFGGYGPEGGYCISVINLGGMYAFSKMSGVYFSDLPRNLNPWTRRAICLFLKEKKKLGEMMGPGGIWDEEFEKMFNEGTLYE